MSHSANVKNAAKLGYTRIGKAICMCRRCSASRTKAVSTIANTKQISQAGKNEPRMSTEGAREQLTTSGVTKKSKSKRLADQAFRGAAMAWGSWRQVGSHPRCEKPNPLEPSGLAFGQVHRWSGPVRVFAELRSRPVSYEARSRRIREQHHRTGWRLPAEPWQPGAAEGRYLDWSMRTRLRWQFGREKR